MHYKASQTNYFSPHPQLQWFLEVLNAPNVQITSLSACSPSRILTFHYETQYPKSAPVLFSTYSFQLEPILLLNE